MLDRLIKNKLQKALNKYPAVALLGPRQVGKTTLAKIFVKQLNAIYLDLESYEDQLKLKDPIDFFENYNDRLIILDEIQRSPDLFMTLRGVIDKNREQGKKSSQFLFLGSASMDLLRQSSESLAGRIAYLNMNGLNVLEIERQKRNTLWLRGGFPDSFLDESDDGAFDWLEYLIRTYIERDIPQLKIDVSSVKLRALWTMLAHLQGETINYSKLAANLEIDSKQVKIYIEILVDLLLVRKIEPWHKNIGKRLVKSPRYYICDSGITHRLLGIDTYEGLISNPILGKSWEGFVVENIFSVLPNRAEVNFYRTAAGAEIDLVIKFSHDNIWAIEIKYGRNPKISKHFDSICEDIGATHKYVIYGGDDEFSIGNRNIIISLEKILNKIISEV